ncbi:uncharacterized protein LOC109806287 [Cajanus cajan]|uniref:uncharacterized protein LOC109806287 n=1 Tax=Cajanus cajan TaxID=3821 RepID=UPI00098DB4E9|nr:uncharacterized protein LOC109806287 [Cajanus cajan]
MEIGWVVRKKRSRRVPIAKYDMFKMLPKELHIEIMKRLVVKHLSMAMCVSKPWRNLILSSCVPTSSLATRNLDHIDYIENEGKDNNGQYSFQYRFSSLVNDINPFPFKDTIHLFRWCSKVIGCNFDLSKHIIGSFNGLLLFCHNEGRTGNQTYGSCHYYAINPITKQCVAVLNPLPHSTPYSSYVALAYDPSESWYFRIVQFKCCCHVNVFSSETGCWTSLSLQLPQNVTEATWDKKLVYSKGAIYWLSTSGHVIKLLLNAQESAK